mmetsp:Transcript_96178/g.170739  ORF Transcript_96178/g.170739 Transcript_96178/m.170739 type:complete len:80 (+) Transcript_96178:1661-1900(+)
MPTRAPEDLVGGGLLPAKLQLDCWGLLIPDALENLEMCETCDVSDFSDIATDRGPGSTPASSLEPELCILTCFEAFADS